MILHIPNNPGRYEEITFIKALAIIAVVLLHSLPNACLLATLAPFHIWQAVPIFFMIAGANRTLSVLRNGAFSFRNEYAIEKTGKVIMRLIIPFTIVWLIEIGALSVKGKLQPNALFTMASLYIKGGYGPGSYFVPAFFQFVAIFPILFWIIQKSETLGLVAIFCISITMEYIYLVLGLSDGVYRILFLRYLFIAVMGIYMVIHGFRSKNVFLFLSLLSFIYIYTVVYVDPTIASNASWLFQSTAGYFYTAFLFLLLWILYSRGRNHFSKLLVIGEASYHIFLLQMAYFAIMLPLVENLFIHSWLLYTLPFMNLIICLPLGIYFMKLTARIENHFFELVARQCT